MRRDLETEVLKGVSRSFYLTLRLLPAPMRPAASLGYLLARTSDTIADTAAVPVDERLAALEGFGAAVAGENRVSPPWPQALLANAEPREQILLDRRDHLLRWLDRLRPGEADLVRTVVDVIISGQNLDLQRFRDAHAENVIALRSSAELEDYCWRVAGCVGAFWTQLGWLTLGEDFSRGPEPWLLNAGVNFGMGLQLVNILRDLPRDLAMGRCYLPVNDPRDHDELLESHRHWLDRARRWCDEGLAYSATLPSRRLRAASALPAMLAKETLAAMHHATWDQLAARVKVPRRRVYVLLAKSLLYR